MSAKPAPNQPPEGARDTNVREGLQALGRVIDEALPQGWGFFLCTFPFNKGEGRCNYIANARREDILVMMRNMVKRLEEADSFGTHADGPPV